MDELDASLDNANIDRLISYVRKESLQTQFIFITHSARVYTQMNSLIGVTKKVSDQVFYLVTNFFLVFVCLGRAG